MTGPVALRPTVKQRVSNAVLRVRKAVVRTVSAATVFTDVSSYQHSTYTNAYPYHFASFRANDGTYRDSKFAGNHAWAKAAATSGRISGFIVYIVWRPNWEETVATLKSMVGTPHPKMAVMIDIESWGGEIRGNHSTGINEAREAIIHWLGGNRKRVIGYGNAGDLASIWPSRGDAQIVLANYSSNPATPKHIAHQYTSSGNVAPFGKPVDMNSADGLTPTQFAAALGLVATPPKPPAKPTLHRKWPSYMKTSKDVFGPITGPAWVHGGVNTAEKADVKAIQQRLQALHFAPAGAGWADGVWESPTTAAMKAWQKAHKKTQTGVCNKVDWTFLFTY